MNDTPLSEQEREMTHEEMISALFAQMVIQQANMAMLLLGKVPHPQTGQTLHDLEGARIFIDQLEMLKVKTKGNLSQQEEQLLKQSLHALHMAFVEASSAPPAGAEAKTSEAAARETAPEKEEIQAGNDGPASDESKKRFTKKY